MVVSIKQKSWLRVVARKGQGDERERTSDEVSKHMKEVSKLGFFFGFLIKSSRW